MNLISEERMAREKKKKDKRERERKREERMGNRQRKCLRVALACPKLIVADAAGNVTN